MGFPYHLNGHKKKNPGQIMDMTNINLLLDELWTVDYYILLLC